jgi:hypothetical protein
MKILMSNLYFLMTFRLINEDVASKYLLVCMEMREY